MIGPGLEFRLLILVALLGAFALRPPPLQEQEFRERQVLDPNTDEWLDAEVPAEESPGDQLGQARLHLLKGKPGRARTLLQKWLKASPEDERTYLATFLLGEAYFGAGDYWKALQQYNTVAENASGDLFHRANLRSVDVARAFLSGQKRIVWGFLRLPAYAEGIEILDRVWERVPGSRLGELALKLKADYYYANGDHDLAQDEYANLVQQYPSGRYTQFAMLRSAAAAEAAFPGIKFDDVPLLEADEKYRQLAAAFPGYAEREGVPERLEGIRQQRADKDLDIARWYQRTGQPSSAEFYYRRVLADWPDTLAATEARTRLRALGVHLPDEAPAETVEP